MKGEKGSPTPGRGSTCGGDTSAHFLLENTSKERKRNQAFLGKTGEISTVGDSMQQKGRVDYTRQRGKGLCPKERRESDPNC